VKVSVKGKGVMRFDRVTNDSFKKTDEIWLHHIGGFDVLTWAFTDWGVIDANKKHIRTWGGGDHISVAGASQIPAIRSLKINNIEDAICHYDELLGILTNWPEYPANTRITLEDGTEFHFAVKKRNRETKHVLEK